MTTFDTDRTRSFALVGHGGHGKTCMADCMALLMGKNTRLGKPDDETSLFDTEPEEHKRGGSISAHFLSGVWEETQLHVVDTPGEGNFLHEARAMLQAVGGVVVVISATDGVEVSTEQVFGFARNQGLARMVFVNKMDREHADHNAIVDEIQEVFGIQPVLLQLPIGKQDDFRGVVDLINHRALLYDGEGGVPTVADIPADMADEVEAATEAMMEAVAMADDELVEQYLEAGELTQEEVRVGLSKGILSGEVVPVLLGSARLNIGVDQVLKASRAFPHQGEGPQVTGHVPDHPDQPVEISAAADAPFAALCVKTLIDPYAGQISMFRVVSGTADHSATMLNPRTGKPERLGTMYLLVGKEHEPVEHVVPGDLFGVAKMRDMQTGDTLCDASRPVVLPYVEPPAAMMAYTITPKSRSDVDKLKSALAKLLAEDAGLRQDYDDITKEVVLAGMGAAHVQISIDKLARKYGVQVELGTPAVPYRETISGSADVRYRHKKQTGGAGQFGEVAIRVSPSDRGEGYVFIDAIKGGVIPNALIPSVKKGVGDQLQLGVLAGFPVVDVQVELYDGKYHPVDSKDIAFQIAGRQAIKEAVMKCRPALLEPVYSVDVVVPSDLVGDVMGDMNGRRGRVLNMDTRGRNSVVKAHVPLAEMLNYSPDLRSMTGGKGTYSMEFSSYEPVPAHMQDKVVAELNRMRDEDD